MQTLCIFYFWHCIFYKSHIYRILCSGKNIPYIRSLEGFFKCSASCVGSLFMQGQKLRAVVAHVLHRLTVLPPPQESDSVKPAANSTQSCAQQDNISDIDLGNILTYKKGSVCF